MYALQPTKRNNPFVLVLAIVCGLALFASVCAWFGGSISPSSASTNHRVTYKISTDRNDGGCYGFDTTYEMPHGTAQQPVSICNGAINATVDQRSGSSGDFVYLSVQNDKYFARIGCQIYIDGKLVYHTFSAGQYVIASCSGSIP